MRWRARTAPSCAKERANISFFIFIIFFAVFGIIILTELLLLERPSQATRYHRDLQKWVGQTEASMTDTSPAPPAQMPQDGVWQPVARTRFSFYVYSAWVERRTVAAIRVIGATQTRGADAVICRLYLPDNRTLTLKSRVQVIRENWNWKYSAVFVLCLLRDTGVKPQDTVGASLAVIAPFAVNKPSTNLLQVMDTEPKPGIKNTLHVCVKPFHFQYERDEWIVEWIQLNRLLGVSHFYMYNKSMTEKMSCVLHHYEKQGLLTILPWHLPIQSRAEIRTEGQFAAFNDCLYRSMANAAWLMLLDTDEVVIPHRATTLLEMLDRLTTRHPRSTKPAAFLFRNVFFYLGWDDDPDAPVPLLTSRKTRRLVTPHALKIRSKYIVRPREIIELGNHFVWEHAPGSTSVGVPFENALLHHYRVVCEYDGDQCLKLPSKIDRTAHKWSNVLWRDVQNELKKIGAVCSR